MADDKSEKKSSGTVTKVITGIFAAVIAPVAVVSLTKIVNRYLEDKPAPNTAPAVVDTHKVPGGSGPIRVGGPVKLITAKLSDDFYTYGWDAKTKGYVANLDVDPALFSYDASTQVIKAPGEFLGSLITKRAYIDYLLTVEYKFGDKTYGDREGKARIGAVMVHGHGADGSIGATTMSGLQIDVGEGRCGNLVLRGNPDQVKADVRFKERKVGTAVQFLYNPMAPPVPVGSGGKGPPGWKDVLLRPGAFAKIDAKDDLPGLRAPGDQDKPHE